MNEEMRKEFEAWWEVYCKDRGFNYSFATLLNGEYANWPEHNAFLGWQASREAMKPIKLPTLSTGAWSMCKQAKNEMLEECREAIEQAGYKVAV